jgi:hypothetical protein
MYHQFNIQQFYVLPTQTAFMCCVWIWEQIAIISLYSINCLVFTAETESVYCAVRTGFWNMFHVTSLSTPASLGSTLGQHNALTVDPGLAREAGVNKPVVATCKKAAMSIYRIVPNWHFSTTLTEVLSVLFPSVVRWMPGYSTQSRGLTLDMTNNMPPQKAYCLLTNGPQFAQVKVFNRDRELDSLRAIPFIVCNWARDAVNAGMTKQAEGRRLAQKPSALRLVRWLLSY